MGKEIQVHYKNCCLFFLFLCGISICMAVYLYHRHLENTGKGITVSCHIEEDYLFNKERSNNVSWTVEEETGNLKIYNNTYFKITTAGMYWISCSLMMESNLNTTDVITMMLLTSKGQTMITKQATLSGFNRFTLHIGKIIKLDAGENFYVKLIPQAYLFKDPMTHSLSINILSSI